jgi:hypothetical protein
MFATASSDRTVKIWKPVSEDLLGSRAEDFGDDSGPNSFHASGNQNTALAMLNQSDIDNSLDYFEGENK